MLKKIIKTVSAICAALILVSCTVNKPADPVRTITVSATGSVSVNPDQVSLIYSIKTQSWWIETAVTNNATATTNVIEALKSCGLDEKDICTYDYRITQARSNSNGNDILNGNYLVSNTISVIIRDVSNVGKVIDTVAAKVGRNSTFLGLSSFEYKVSDTTTAKRQARTLAIQNAQDAASLLAGASGCKVDSVMEIREDYITSSSNLQAKYFSRASDSVSSPTTPITEGTVTVTSNVTVTYSLTN